jgi:hypothetical protein
MGKFIIVGGGPTGLITAILLNNFLQEFLNGLNIEIYDNRFDTIGRLRQVIILKKEYGMVQKLFEVPELIEHMSQYMECVLKNPQNKQSNFTVGPYSCTKKLDNFLTDDTLTGITITIYNLERCLIEFIKKKYEITTKLFKQQFNITDFNKDDIIIGCSGANGTIRKYYTQIEELNPEVNTEYIMNYDKNNKLLEHSYAGTEEDSYMLILRLPIYKNESIEQDIAFAHYGEDKQPENIMITNYIYPEPQSDEKYKTYREKTEYKDKTIYYRQMYYAIDKNTFVNMSDCGFWNYCSLKDVLFNRVTISKILPVNSEINSILPPNTVIGEKVVNIPDFGEIHISNIINTTLSFLIHQVEIYTAKNLMNIFKKGSKFRIKKSIINRPYIDELKNGDDIYITISEFNIIGFYEGQYLELYYQLIPKETIDIILNENEVMYLYNDKPNENKTKIIKKIKDDIQRFNPNIVITDDDIENNSELVRIYTSVRYSSQIHQKVNGINTLILGDEAILVNPMTGRGVSNSLLLSYNFVKTISKYKSLKEIIINFEDLMNEFKNTYFIPQVSSVLHQGEMVRNNFKRHSFYNGGNSKLRKHKTTKKLKRHKTTKKHKKRKSKKRNK